MSDAESASILLAVLRDLDARRQAAAGGSEHQSLVSEAHAQLLAALPPTQLALLQSASALVRRRQVTRVAAQPSGRRFFRVEALGRFQQQHRENEDENEREDEHEHEAGRPHFYNVLPHFCSCRGFRECTAAQSPTAMCKHMLAALLADATGQLEHAAIQDVDFATMLCAQLEPANDHTAGGSISH